MSELSKGYCILFNAVTDALRAMNRENYGTAEEILIAAQQNAEEAYLCEAAREESADEEKA